MDKIIVDHKNYTFDSTEGTVKLWSHLDILSEESLLLITNVSTNTIIYNFGCDGLGGSISNRNTITLDYDTSSMNDSDRLQIILYDFGRQDRLLTEFRTMNRNLNNIIETLNTTNNLLQLILS